MTLDSDDELDDEPSLCDAKVTCAWVRCCAATWLVGCSIVLIAVAADVVGLLVSFSSDAADIVVSAEQPTQMQAADPIASLARRLPRELPRELPKLEADSGGSPPKPC